MAILRRIWGIHRTYSGEVHTGWLPPGAAIPLPTPVRHVTFDLTIESDGAAFLVICDVVEGEGFGGDDWCLTLEQAMKCAEQRYGVDLSDWQDA